MNSLFEISPNEAPAVTKDNGRWLVLILLFMTTFGSLFAFDSISVLQSTLEQTLEIDQFKLDLLDDIAIIPNIALPIIAGLIIDRYGIRPTFLLFSILIAVGQLVVYLGVTYTSFYIVLLGRFVFGLGYQSQYVAKCVLVTRWANSTELSFALSLSAFLSRLGTSISVIASPTLSQDYGLTAPFLLGLILVALQVVLVLAVIYADKKSNVAVDEYRNFNDVVVLRDIWMFAKPFYILASGCALASGIFFSFFQNGSSLLTQQFGMDSSQADTVLNIVFAISAFGLPIFGFIADRVNNKLTIIPWFALIFVIAAFQLAFRQGSEPGNPDFFVLINLIFYGLFYACINATLWSCIPAVAILTKIGIACGFTLSLIEIMMFVLPMLADGIFNATADSGNGYLSTNVLYASLGVITLGLMVWLRREDKKADDLLSGKSSRPKGGDSSPKKAQVLEMKMEKFMKFENDTMTDL